MKLTTSQIAIIEETLVLNELIYEDIKIELTDHIASEIEILLDEKEINFEDALKTVFEKWSPELKPTTSFWTPNYMKLPRIVLNKYKVEYKKQFLTISIGATLSTFLLIFLTHKINSQYFIEFIKNSFQVIFIVELLLSLLCKIWIIKTKKVTFYSMSYQKQTSFILFFLLLLAIGFLPLRLGNENIYRQIISNFIVLSYTLLPLVNLKFVFSHFKILQKLKNC